jgi:hypothetical protein
MPSCAVEPDWVRAQRQGVGDREEYAHLTDEQCEKLKGSQSARLRAQRGFRLTPRNKAR